MSGECEKCHEHTLDCICKKENIKKLSLKMGSHLSRMFKEIEKEQIKIREDEYHVYYYNASHDCWTKKSKHWMRLNAEI